MGPSQSQGDRKNVFWKNQRHTNSKNGIGRYANKF